MENEIPRFRCYYCTYTGNLYADIIEHIANVHPESDVKYRRREVKYRTIGTLYRNLIWWIGCCKS